MDNKTSVLRKITKKVLKPSSFISSPRKRGDVIKHQREFVEIVAISKIIEIFIVITKNILNSLIKQILNDKDLPEISQLHW